MTVTDGSVALTVDGGGDGSELRSRRFHRAEGPTGTALTLTGTHVTAWTLEQTGWVARARHDLREVLDTRDEAALADLVVDLPAGGRRRRSLRPARPARHEVRHHRGRDAPARRRDRVADRDLGRSGVLRHRAHQCVVARPRHARGHPRRRPVLPTSRPTGRLRRPRHPPGPRDGDGWLVATSTWGDFERPATRAGRRTPAGLRVTLAESDADLLHGAHVLDTRELPLPTDGLASIATWDPHLVRRDDGWLVGFVSARRFFDFHPALAGGPGLDDLRLLGAATDRTATEGTTLVEVDGRTVVLASDGRDSPRGRRARFPAFDLAMTERGVLDAPYPTNLPWPTLAAVDGGWVMATFDGRAGGREAARLRHPRRPGADAVAVTRRDYAGSDGGHHPSTAPTRSAHPAAAPTRKGRMSMSGATSSGVDVFELGSEHEQVVFCNDRAERPPGHHRDPLHRPRPGPRRHPLLPLRQRPTTRSPTCSTSRAGCPTRPRSPASTSAAARPSSSATRPTLKTEALLRAYGRFVQSLGGRYFTACDVGTFSEDMDHIARECDYVTGRTVAHGGAGDSSVLTAYGVFQGMRAAAERRLGRADAGRSHRRRRRGRQGRPPPGAPPRRGRRRRRRHRRARPVGRARSATSYPQVQRRRPPPRRWSPSELDVYAPCALGGALDRRGASRCCAPRSSAAPPTTSSPTRASRRRSRSAASSTPPTTASTPAA